MTFLDFICKITGHKKDKLNDIGIVLILTCILFLYLSKDKDFLIKDKDFLTKDKDFLTKDKDLSKNLYLLTDETDMILMIIIFLLSIKIFYTFIRMCNIKRNVEYIIDKF